MSTLLAGSTVKHIRTYGTYVNTSILMFEPGGPRSLCLSKFLEAEGCQYNIQIMRYYRVYLYATIQFIHIAKLTQQTNLDKETTGNYTTKLNFHPDKADTTKFSPLTKVMFNNLSLECLQKVC